MRWKSDLVLLFVAAVWGTGFVSQRLATTQLGAFYFNGGRFLIAALVILLFSRLPFLRSGDRSEAQTTQQVVSRQNVGWMVLAGVLLFAGSGLRRVSSRHIEQ